MVTWGEDDEIGCRLRLRKLVHKLLFARSCWIILDAPFWFKERVCLWELLRPDSDLVWPSMTAHSLMREEMGIIVVSSFVCYDTPLGQDFVGFFGKFFFFSLLGFWFLFPFNILWCSLVSCVWGQRGNYAVPFWYAFSKPLSVLLEVSLYVLLCSCIKVNNPLQWFHHQWMQDTWC